MKPERKELPQIAQISQSGLDSPLPSAKSAKSTDHSLPPGVTLRLLDQSVFDRAQCQTPLDRPCILIAARHQKLSIAQARDLHRFLSELLDRSLDASMDSLRRRVIEHRTGTVPEDLLVTPTPSSKGRPGPPVSALSPLGRLLKLRRAALGLRATDLASQAHVGEATISGLENGWRVGQPAILRRLAAALKLSSDAVARAAVETAEQRSRNPKPPASAVA